LVTQQLDTLTGAEIKALRTEMGLTLEELAFVVGCSFYTIWRWETGKTLAISGKNGEVLARVLAAWKVMPADARAKLTEMVSEKRRVAMKRALNPRG
jgi:transcriptional regulator with XRE-family HTH domain